MAAGRGAAGWSGMMAASRWWRWTLGGQDCWVLEHCQRAERSDGNSWWELSRIVAVRYLGADERSEQYVADKVKNKDVVAQALKGRALARIQ